MKQLSLQLLLLFSFVDGEPKTWTHAEKYMLSIFCLFVPSLGWSSREEDRLAAQITAMTAK